MKQLSFRSFVGLMAATFAYLTPILLVPFAVLGDRILTLGLTFLDFVFPMPHLAFAGGHPMRPTREVTYLTTGLHRLAQPISARQGDPGDEDEDDDEDIDNGLTGACGQHRLNC